MADPNPLPVIPDLQPGDWIDLDKLGSDALRTYIKFPGIAIGMALWPNWRGCGVNGESADHANSRLDVTTQGGYTPELGMPALVPNVVLKALDQGRAFYSYAVAPAGDPNNRGPESLRLFCYVGQRPVQVVSLPVPHIEQSHDLALDPDDLDSLGATAVVPPYRAMGVGDRVILTFEGYDDTGYPDDTHQETKVLRAEDLGQALTFNVPYSAFLFIRGGHAEISYRIEYANGAGHPSDSTVQTLDIVKRTTPLLAPVTLKDYSGGPINPGHYPTGLRLQIIPAYTGIQAGDWVLLYWTGSSRAKSVIKALRVDPSTVDSGVIEFMIEPRWLSDNSNGQVTVSYQFARQAAALSAEPLTLDISKPLYLPPPIVAGATPEGGAGDKGWLMASTDGVYVSVPETAEMGSGKVEMHWQGHPNGGRYIALAPEAGEDRKYFIPASALAANMSNLEQARFPVFYRVFPAGGTVGEDSEHFNLRMTPLPATRYPFTTSPNIVNNQMSLFNVDIGGAILELHSNPPTAAWPFMAQGQLLTMEASGVSKTGIDISEIVRDALPVTPVEMTNNKVTMRLRKAFLNQLMINEPFTLKARVSFNGGDTYTEFKDSTPTLVP